MTIETKYDIGQAVTLIAIKWPGRVVTIEMTGKNLLYRVQYWAEFDIKYCYVTEEELCAR